MKNSFICLTLIINILMMCEANLLLENKRARNIHLNLQRNRNVQWRSRRQAPEEQYMPELLNLPQKIKLNLPSQRYESVSTSIDPDSRPSISVTSQASAAINTTDKVNDVKSSTTLPTTIDAVETKEPLKCEAAILNCCRFTEDKYRSLCFSLYNCSKTYATNLACKKNIIQNVIQKFKDSIKAK